MGENPHNSGSDFYTNKGNGGARVGLIAISDGAGGAGG
jgi:hypothetical protein